MVLKKRYYSTTPESKNNTTNYTVPLSAHQTRLVEPITQKNVEEWTKSSWRRPTHWGFTDGVGNRSVLDTSVFLSSSSKTIRSGASIDDGLVRRSGNIRAPSNVKWNPMAPLRRNEPRHPNSIVNHLKSGPKQNRPIPTPAWDIDRPIEYFWWKEVDRAKMKPIESKHIPNAEPNSTPRISSELFAKGQWKWKWLHNTKFHRTTVTKSVLKTGIRTPKSKFLVWSESWKLVFKVDLIKVGLTQNPMEKAPSPIKISKLSLVHNWS